MKKKGVQPVKFEEEKVVEEQHCGGSPSTTLSPTGALKVIDIIYNYINCIRQTRGTKEI